MSATLAADAASVELTADGHDIAELLRDAASGDDPNPLAVRDALLELAHLTAEAEQVDSLRKQIVERYDEKKKKLAGRASAIRDSLLVYAKRYGKTSFPDVGGIHLTTQSKGGEPYVVNAVEFEDWLTENGYADIVEANTETVPKFNAKNALGMLLDANALRATPEGNLVSIEDGLIWEEPACIGVLPETKILAVRKS